MSVTSNNIFVNGCTSTNFSRIKKKHFKKFFILRRLKFFFFQEGALFLDFIHPAPPCWNYRRFMERGLVIVSRNLGYGKRNNNIIKSGEKQFESQATGGTFGSTGGGHDIDYILTVVIHIVEWVWGPRCWGWYISQHSSTLYYHGFSDLEYRRLRNV